MLIQVNHAAAVASGRASGTSDERRAVAGTSGAPCRYSPAVGVYAAPAAPWQWVREIHPAAVKAVRRARGLSGYTCRAGEWVTPAASGTSDCMPRPAPRPCRSRVVHPAALPSTAARPAPRGCTPRGEYGRALRGRVDPQTTFQKLLDLVTYP